MAKKRKAKPMIECGGNFIRVRDLLAQVREMKGRKKWEANGCPNVGRSEREPWKHWGECCGSTSTRDSESGSWSNVVRAYEDWE